MGLETATYIDSLVVTNPISTDKKKEGDNHLRLLKEVLKNTFPNATKAFRFPTSSTSQTANFTVVAADANKTFLIDTTAGSLVATLPTLVLADAGWECFFLKTNTGTSPFFIAPPTGTIQSGDQGGLARTRRSIPGVRTRALWTGGAWIAERAVNSPVGTILDCPRSGLPVGYEFAMGQTLTSASTDYPDYYQANGNSGVVTDRQGRAAFGRTNMDGTDNGLITNAASGIVGTTLGATGGLQAENIAQAKLPNVTIDNGTLNVAVPGQTYTSGTGAQGSLNGGATIFLRNTDMATVGTLQIAGSTASINGGVTQEAYVKMPPSIITNMIVVVE